MQERTFCKGKILVFFSGVYVCAFICMCMEEAEMENKRG